MKKTLYDFCMVNEDKKYLLEEWDYRKNNIKPNEITAGSSKDVWWICKKGHSYECRIGHRTSDNVGCPYCKGSKVLKGFNDLCTTHPKLIKEWNYSKNIKGPDEFSKGSNVKVWWVCKYGHEWKAAIHHRTQGRGCPICSCRKIVKGVNDFKTWCIENNKQYLLDEWNYSKNKRMPDDYPKGSEENVWWICKNGHEWEARIGNRVMLGRNCPICSNQKVLKGVNDFATKYPKLLEEWDYDKNIIKPDEISQESSKYKIWWKCKSGHSWEATIRRRTVDGTGCPYCFSERQTSFSEQAIYYYIRKVFSDAVNSYDIGKQFKLDVFIPFLSLGIEYDGSAWHQDIDKDIRKNELCKYNRIRLIRVREEGCPKMSNNSFLKIINCRAIDIKRYIYDLDSSIKEIFYVIEKLLGKKIVIDINVERDRNNIYVMYKQNKYEKSLEYLRPDLLKEWDYELNVGLDPSVFTLGSQAKVHWICSKGHKYETTISKRVKSVIGCPYCSNHKVLTGYNDLATTHPKLVEEWDFTKNLNIYPNKIHSGSNLLVWWKCKSCGFEWQTKVYIRKNGCGCPNCGVIKVAEKKMIKVRNLDTGEVFNSLKDAAEFCNLKSSQTISDCCKGKLKSAGGYHWEYYNENK